MLTVNDSPHIKKCRVEGTCYHYLGNHPNNGIINLEDVIFTKVKPLDYSEGYCRDIIWVPEWKLFVGMTTEAISLFSSDGLTWTKTPHPELSSLGISRLCYSPLLKKIIAITWSTSTLVTDNGKDWRVLSTSGRPHKDYEDQLIWSNSLNSFLQRSRSFLVSSSDGVSWEDRPIDNLGELRSLTWAPELDTHFLTTSSMGVFKSNDAYTWEKIQNLISGGDNFISYSPKLGMLLHTSVPHKRAQVSYDKGVTWEERTTVGPLYGYTQWIPNFNVFTSMGTDWVDYGLSMSLDGVVWKQVFAGITSDASVTSSWELKRIVFPAWYNIVASSL